MGLFPGEKLGPYEILALIGRGGMGEVYRARDPRLNRDVAIKVSNAQFTERFSREARSIAALNHTNICHLYDVGPDYLVMEYVEGHDLRGPMDFEDALPIVQQLIDGIEAAHERNIVHRDLKPANIKITPEGVVKILDFGLAKAMEAPSASSDGNPENSPTLTMGATAAGTILGTAAYMAPEQAKGKTADRRSDIWSFGVIVYEMLTGKRLFEGESAVEILGGVLNQEPDISAAPVRVQKLLRWCLEKDRKQRLRDIGDARRLLAESGADGPTATSPTRFGRLGWIAAGVLALIALGLSFAHFSETPPAEPTLRSTIALPESSLLHSFAISPDGHNLVIAAAINGKQQLWLRAMDALQAKPMPFTEDATYPFWSPDSRYIGFFAQGKLKKVAVSGGPAQTLCDAPNGRGGSWNRDDVIVFSPNSLAISIQRVAAAGGIPVDVTNAQGSPKCPEFLPDGRRFLYMNMGTSGLNGVYVSSLDGKENRRVLADASCVVFAPSSGHDLAYYMLFLRENTLMALPFDTVSAQVSGDAFPLAEGISSPSNSYYVPSTISRNGVLLYEALGISGGKSQVGWYDRSGKSLGLVGAPGGVSDLALSPDEKSIVFRCNSLGTGSDLWVSDVRRGTETRLTSDASANMAPVWSPQSDRIVFASNRKGGIVNLYQKAVGSGQEELLLPNGLRGIPSQWSPDGRFIIYQQLDAKSKSHIWVLPTEGPAADRKPIPFLRSEFNESLGRLAPDSRWMAFSSDSSGRLEVYVRPFPSGDREWTISIAGGRRMPPQRPLRVTQPRRSPSLDRR